MVCVSTQQCLESHRLHTQHLSDLSGVAGDCATCPIVDSSENMALTGSWIQSMLLRAYPLIEVVEVHPQFNVNCSCGPGISTEREKGQAGDPGIEGRALWWPLVCHCDRTSVIRSGTRTEAVVWWSELSSRFLPMLWVTGLIYPF